MSMEVVRGLPPNYDAIAKRFGFTTLPAKFHPVFAYGDKLYNPFGGEIPEHLMAHEETHQRQQNDLGSVKQWWDLYLENDGFRLKQEVEAYQAQFRFISQHFNRQHRRFMLQQLASDLSSELYGNLVSKAEAENLITQLT